MPERQDATQHSRSVRKIDCGSRKSHHRGVAKEWGSPQESDEGCILCGSLQSDEFGLGKRQSLCFEQQILDVAIAATAAQQRFDIPVDGFDHT